MPVDANVKYRGFNSYYLEPNEKLNSDPFDVRMYQDITFQLAAVRLTGNTNATLSVHCFDEDNKPITPGVPDWIFPVSNRWAEVWQAREMPEGTITMHWELKAGAEGFHVAIPKAGPGILPTAFSDNSTRRESKLTADGLYTSTVSADQVYAGILRAISGGAWFDLEKPEIVMQGKDGTVLKSSPDNPLRIEDKDGDLVGGLARLRGALKLIAGAISNAEDAKTYIEVGKMPDENNIERDGIRIVNELLNKPVLEMPIGGSGDSRELLLKLFGEKWLKLYMLGSEYGNQTIWLDLGPGHIWSRKSTPGDDFIQITVGSGSDKPELYIGENDVRIAFFESGVGQNALGIDNTGPYLIKAGTKTYF